MTLDPETIAMILAIVFPMIMDCFSGDEPITPEEAKQALKHPTRRQRIVLMVALPWGARRKLRRWWKENKDNTDDDTAYGMDDELAEEVIEEAQEELELKRMSQVKT